jgi:hypothetical protein
VLLVDLDLVDLLALRMSRKLREEGDLIRRRNSLLLLASLVVVVLEEYGDRVLSALGVRV